MLRADSIICGTSSTGTGALTLAACPSPPGGIDPYAWLTATGFNFANGAAVPISYTIIEYTDSTFATAKRFEKGIGTLTLGASLTASTLARTTVESTSASLDTTGSPTYSAPSAVSIGTAANTLIFVGPSAADIPAWSPYYENTLGDNLGAQAVLVESSQAPGVAVVSATDYYWPFEWRVPMLVKKASMRVWTPYSGGTPVSNAYARIYAINSSGRPGKLLIDFGLLGSAGTSLNAGSNISSAVHASGFLLLPGEYFFDFIAVLSGGTTPPKMQCPAVASYLGYLISGRLGQNAMLPQVSAQATSGTGTPAPDPANLTGYALQSSFTYTSLFALAPS